MVVSAAEPSATVLRRRWTSTWDAIRFAGERPLHKPAYVPDVCTAQFELAAQAVVRLRDAVGKSCEEMVAIPLEGRSAAALEAAVDGIPGSLPHPVLDPTGFIRELIHAALQTGDGEYALGLTGAQAVDCLIEEHCADLIDASKLLLDPQAAQRSVDKAIGGLQEAVRSLGSSLPIGGPAKKEDTFKLSAALLLLSRDVRRLAENAGKALTSEPPGSPTRASAEEAPASNEKADEAGILPHPPPEEAPDANEGEDAGTPLRRTKSQFIKKVKVEEVAKVADERREPVRQLRRLLSQLDKPHEVSSDEAAQAARYVQATKELKEVQRLQQSFRNFGEDLMEGMLALDGISGLAEEDRQRRKETIRSIQGLLDEIDAAKPRVNKIHQSLAKEVDSLHHVAPQQESVAQDAKHEDVKPPQKQTGAAQPALQHPETDWDQVKLPVQFSSVERPQAYTLSASVPGLQSDSISLKLNKGGVLSVAGLRVPTSQEQRQLAYMLSDHVQRLPASRRSLLQQQDIDNMAVQLGHGRFGRFVEEFELPRDARHEEIECTYTDGVLCVVIPRHPQLPTYSSSLGMPPLGSARHAGGPWASGAGVLPLGFGGYPTRAGLFDTSNGLLW